MKKNLKPTTTESGTNKELVRELGLLREELRLYNSWSQRLLLAILTGFGTVIGATVVVAIIVYILTQLANIEILKPFIEEIVSLVQKSHT